MPRRRLAVVTHGRRFAYARFAAASARGPERPEREALRPVLGQLLEDRGLLGVVEDVDLPNARRISRSSFFSLARTMEGRDEQAHDGGAGPAQRRLADRGAAQARPEGQRADDEQVGGQEDGDERERRTRPSRRRRVQDEAEVGREREERPRHGLRRADRRPADPGPRTEDRLIQVGGSRPPHARGAPRGPRRARSAARAADSYDFVTVGASVERAQERVELVAQGA